MGRLCLLGGQCNKYNTIRYDTFITSSLSGFSEPIYKRLNSTIVVKITSLPITMPEYKSGLN